ncbi:MAG: adenylate/guanylate cyclase domain-containing protein [Cyanobacteria bacterium P01_D01_bin.123]
MWKRLWSHRFSAAARTPSRLRRQLVSISGWTAGFALLWVLDTPWVSQRIAEDLPASISGPIAAFQTRANPLPRLELGVQTLLTQLRGTTPPLDEVVILAIDDPSHDMVIFPEELAEYPILQEMQSWPWSRRVHAEAARMILDAGAKVVAFDIVFDKPSPYGPEDDRAFEQLLDDYGDRVVLGARYYLASAVAGSRDQLLLPYYIRTHPDTLVGYVNVKLAADTAVYELATNYAIPDDVPTIPSLAETVLQVTGRTTDAIGDEWLRYSGPAATYATFSYQDLMVPAMRTHNLRDGEVFRDRVVIVGATARILQDFQLTPWGIISGPEIQATNVATLIEDKALRPVPLPLQLMLLALAAGAGGWAITRPTTVSGVSIATIGAISLWGSTGFGLFALGWVLPNMAATAGALASIGIADAISCAIADRMSKLRLRRTLERYVSPQVAAEIAFQKEDFEALLKGRSLDTAILFSDIRGFTTLSSKLPPEVLLPQLNQYLGAMVEAITTRQGCVDKFIGDAVMAAFGSPISSGPQQDALNAVMAALDMRSALDELRRTWAEQGQPIFFNGIGINFGEAIAGNIGSPQRLEYTVIGDAVNVASRVESLTKEFSTDLLITQSVYDLVCDDIEAIPLGSRKLRGRSQDTRLYQVIGVKGESQDLFERVHRDYERHRLAQAQPAIASQSKL